MERPWWKRPCADAEREDGGAPAPHQAPAKAQRQHTMTGPEDSHSSTRPISVAELLARNGTIGAPPVGGRRRRRRGNSDSVTVAELTGEIPLVREQELHDVDETEAVDDVEAERASESESVDDLETESVDDLEAERASESESVDDLES